MNEYQLGRDIQSILSRLDAIEAAVHAKGTQVDCPERHEAEVAAIAPEAFADSGPVVFRFDPWSVDNIVFDGTLFSLYEPGQWIDVCPCKNVSRHSNWAVEHGLSLKRATGEEIFRIRCWYGRFGAGYSETKRATGATLLIHDYWPQLIRAEVQVWQWMNAYRV